MISALPVSFDEIDIREESIPIFFMDVIASFPKSSSPTELTILPLKPSLARWAATLRGAPPSFL